MNLKLLRNVCLMIALVLSNYAWSLTREPQSYVISSKLSNQVAGYYFDNGFKHRRSVPSTSSLDRLIIYGCEIERRLEHLQVIYICETPSESDIEEQAFLLPIPSPIDQLNIARAIISGDIEIAVIYSRKSEIQYKYLETNKHESIRISGYKSYGSLKFDQQVKDVIKQNDAVLALADESIFNESTQRALMLNTYRERRPVFGPNESFVVSGSIATLCITEEDIAKSAIRLIKSFEETEYLPGIYFPISPKIVTNNTAAKTFSLKLPDDEIIGKKILQASLGDKVNEF